jgi:hypothetical protein
VVAAALDVRVTPNTALHTPCVIRYTQYTWWRQSGFNLGAQVASSLAAAALSVAMVARPPAPFRPLRSAEGLEMSALHAGDASLAL